MVRYFIIANDSTDYQKFDINEKSSLIHLIYIMILFYNVNNLIFVCIKMWGDLEKHTEMCYIMLYPFIT